MKEEEDEESVADADADIIPPGIPTISRGDESIPPPDEEQRRKKMENLALRDKVREKQKVKEEAKLKAIEEGAQKD